MINRFKSFADYGIDSIDTLFLLPESTIDMILTECFSELPKIPRNIYNITKLTVNKTDINTKIEFLLNIDKYIEEEQLILDNLDILSELDDFNVSIKATIPTTAISYTPSSNLLYSSLFDFQKKAFGKFIKEKHILISKTGSGKTITALAIAEQLYMDRKVDGIIVILANDEQVFIDELSKHLPIYSHSKYKTMTYFNMKNKIPTIRGVQNHLFILDEVHLLKNESVRGEYIKSLSIKHMLGLSATIFDKVSDLETLSSNLGLNIGNECIIKMDTNKEPVTSIIECPLTLNVAEKDLLKLAIKNCGGIFELQHKTIQLLSLRGDRMAELLTILQRHKEDKVLVFTNYIATAKHLSEMVEDSMLIIGGEAKSAIQTKLRQFFYGKFQALITTSVLNQSYNLQQANVLVFYDFNYDSIKAQQTEGRIVRINQEKECYIYYIYYKDTLEEEIYHTILKKKREYLESLEVLNNG